MMLIKNTFDIAQSVFLKTDKAQNECIVTGIMVRPNQVLLYELSCGSLSSFHYEFELTAEKDVLKSTMD